ncbi:MAG: AMP-binding protein, partial [Nitrosospira sp.]
MADLVHKLIFRSADHFSDREALVYQGKRIGYAALAKEIDSAGKAMLALGLDQGERVAVYLEKRPETVTALFGAAAAGGVFVPVNPLLKPEQVAYILRDCNVRILVTSADRVRSLAAVLSQCHDLHTVMVVNPVAITPVIAGLNVISWNDALAACERGKAHSSIDSDMAAILYTSGSTGKPKGVVLSHR